VRDSNFVLGYLLFGIAAQQLGRLKEANDYYAVTVDIDPTIQPVTDVLRSGDYNTVLVVTYGLGPRKIGYGPDNALARFEPRTASDNAPLMVSIGNRRVGGYGFVCDVNRMAADHMWNNLEDVRKAKSLVGNVLLVGGAAATGYGLHQDDQTAALAGLGAMAAGLVAKAGAHADTRYCEVFPQRFYVLPLMLTSPREVIELQIEGKPASRMLLAGLGPPDGPEAQLRYVRLNSVGGAPQWATSGRIYYGNDRTGALERGNWPYILGGWDVRKPSPQTLSSYQQTGYLSDFTVGDLGELYRAEGIRTAEGGVEPIRHILERGRSLEPPLAGTAGFARLFGQPHPPYEPKSPQVKSLAERIRRVSLSAPSTTKGEK